MRFFATVFVLFLLSFLGACTQQEIVDTADVPVDVELSAAFTTLSHVDVYGADGEYLKTINDTKGFRDVLPRGTYFMDFVNEDGDHSFMDDGRLTFAPMTDGATPLDGPFNIDEADVPVWEVAVDPVLEGNARLNMRIRDGDETLLPWAHKLGMEYEDSDEEETAIVASPKNHNMSSESWMRARLIWEASFAMTGNFSSSSNCSSGSSCWNGTATSSGSTSYFAKATSGNTNPSGQTYYSYIDYDRSAWEYLRAEYTAGDLSCKDSGYDSATYGTCYVPTNGSASGSSSSTYATKYACQASSCTSSTKPRGGQCKGFANLVAYRSGVFHKGSSATGSGSYYDFASDSRIDDTSATAYASYPKAVARGGSSASYTRTVAAGDVLRQPISSSLHSAILVYVSGSTYRVIDSNWVNTSGSGYNYEYIGSHTMSFSGSSCSTTVNTNLYCYRIQQCIYSSGDSRCY